MITSSGKHCKTKKEVELKLPLSISCKMYMFVIEILQKSKYHYLAPLWHTSGRPEGPSHLQVLFLQTYNCSVVGQGKCDIDIAALWPKPVN